MTQRDTLNAIGKFFGDAHPKTADGVGYRNEFISWFKELSWFDKTLKIDSTLQNALYYKTQYQLAERASIIDSRLPTADSRWPTADNRQPITDAVFGDDWTPGKYKTPGTQVPKPAGYHRAMPHEVTKPVLTFANQVLEVANPKPRLPQSHIIGKRIPGVVEGRPLLAQIEWHFDNHPARPEQGLGPMEGDPFYHMGVSLYMPDATDQIGYQPSAISNRQSAIGFRPENRKNKTMNNFLRDYIGDDYGAIAPPPPPPRQLAVGHRLSVRPPPPPPVLHSAFLPRAPFLPTADGRLPLGPEHRSAFTHPLHHSYGHPDDWRFRQEGDQGTAYRRMQRHAEMLALHDPSSITPANSYAPSYAPTDAPIAPAITNMSDSISDSLPNSTTLPVFLPPQDDSTDLSFDTEINDEDLSNPGDSESDVQIAADFGAGRRTTGTRRASGSRPRAPTGSRQSAIGNRPAPPPAIGTQQSAIGQQSQHHHHHHHQQDQQQQQDQGQSGGGSSGGGGDSGGSSDGGSYSNDSDDSDNFEGECLAGSFAFDGFYSPGSGSQRFG